MRLLAKHHGTWVHRVIISFFFNPLFRTVFKQEAQIAVTGWLQFKDYIEDFCISRFQMNASKGRTALEEALELVYEETKEQITDIIRDVTGIPLQHNETPEEILATTKDVAYVD